MCPRRRLVLPHSNFPHTRPMSDLVISGRLRYKKIMSSAVKNGITR
jgi:hypothetical protein